MVTTEEKAIQILANSSKGNIELMLNTDDFVIAYNAALLVLIATEGDSGGIIVSNKEAYNEYEHLLIDDPKNEYLNVFKHISKL